MIPEVTRIELCAALSEGGVTPSVGFMRMAAGGNVPVYAMIRPRAGDFVFGEEEEALMRADIVAARDAGLAGVVLGASLPDGRLDVSMLARLSADAHGLGRTLHRAFDLVPDPEEALEQAIGLGFERVLTSGGARSAADGTERLRALVMQARGRIDIMAGSGVTAGNVADLVSRTGVGAVHSSGRGAATDTPARIRELGFGGRHATADSDVIRAIHAALRVADTGFL